jgi:hypothetical protein
MAADEELFDPSDEDQYVPAFVARSREEAQRYCDLLDDHDIPACVGDPEALEDAEEIAAPGRLTRGVAVMVPEALLDEASEVIADREDAEEFLLEEEDLLDDEDEDEFDLEEELDPEDPIIDLDDDDEEDLFGDEDDEDLFEDDEDDEAL